MNNEELEKHIDALHVHCKEQGKSLIVCAWMDKSLGIVFNECDAGQLLLFAELCKVRAERMVNKYNAVILDLEDAK